MTEEHIAKQTLRTAARLAELTWLTVVSRVAMVIMPLVLAGIGAIALEWRADFKRVQTAAQETGLRTAVILERVTIRQESLQRNDEKQDVQIDRIWQRFRKDAPGE